MKLLTTEEKQLVTELDHPIYTDEFLEEWINRSDNVFVNAPAALQCMTAYGFYEAVRYMSNKKAPDGLPSDLSAQELVQAQNSTDKKDCQIPAKILLELAAMQTRYKEIGRSYGLAGIGSNYIQLTPDSFLDTFSEFAVNILPGMLYPEELSTEYYSVKFMCVR